MLGHRTRIVAKRALVIGAAGIVAGLLGSGIASAAVGVDQFENWNGDFPVIGNLDPITTETVTSLPDPVTVGTASAAFPVSVTITAPPLATEGLELLGATSISGTADVTVDGTDAAGNTVEQPVHLTIPATPTPAAGSDFVVVASGSTNIPAIADPGPVVLTIESPASTTLDAVNAQGQLVIPEFTVTLTQDATGPSQNPSNDPTLGTINAE